MANQRITRVFGAVNIGSFRISAIVAGINEVGDMVVLGSGHRASQGIKRGFVTDMAAATYAVRDAIDRAEKMADTAVQKVWIGCSGAGLASRIDQFDAEIGGRRIEQEDIDQLLISAKDVIQPDGRMVLHAQPAQYRLDGAHGVIDPKGLHAERLGVDIHIMLADGAPIRNLTEAVQSAHLEVEAVVGSPIAAGQACLSPEERDLGVALVEFGGEVTNVAIYEQGMLKDMMSIPMGSADITDAIASAFGIRRFQAERLKCVNGSAIASPHDHREMIPVNAPGEEGTGPIARHADDKNRIPRAELIGVITGQLGMLMEEVNKALKTMRFTGQRGKQVVFTGGGAELVGLADYAQAAIGKPVRIGRVAHLSGLAEAHVKPGFSTLAGLVLYAAADPQDIRSLGRSHQSTVRLGKLGMVGRVYQALREYF
ncbi:MULTISPECIES: cell division protein FtsA [Sphingomonadaceae]|jgi:cell division protein FtsA|uniref:Cell division protein FtsA n=1 Tax=Novosphingobium resinovorum TaxID=158500 RepID=A0A031JX49_9SPHN|nr:MULTISPECIES: cell division protein FtsA [Sphingomonadaceae]AOR76993.1 cell division protein FtsA [Novosphingobium resinovorum]EJU12483.1 cell division protein FtsA [Sphingomonas sp. LH128]EZP81353.1 Cell division protein ftsA [Novosphingobium resinovorum]MBF7012376.1 cell division protein FtsA [Novosphingobium sp. HR1a]MEE4453873.1 cell division protein FtsA [Novosphingobium resinovorum]